MKEKRFDAVCIGLLVADVLVKPIDADLFERDSTRIEKIEFSPGGDAVNESVTLSDLGLKTLLMAKIGTDTFGEAVLNRIRERKVDTSCIKPSAQTITSTSVVLINESGARSIVFCAGNNDHLSLEDIDFDIISSTKVVSIAGLCALSRLDGEGTASIFREAKKAGAVTVADTNIDIYGIGLDGLTHTLESTDYFIPSYNESKSLTGESAPEKIARKILERGAKTVVIKMGNKGCFIMNAEECLTLPPYDVKVTDTTGCGDNFVSGFITGIVKGWDLRQCGQFANAMGSLNSMNIGACSVHKSTEEVLTFMENTSLCAV
jgi:sugar/nucleoside kinase (ribokinase family)